jgi:YbbR domain-containing protein
MNWLRVIFISNWKNKLLALVLALCVWLIVNSRITVESKVRVEVVVDLSEAPGVDADVTPAFVEITFRGPKRSIEERLSRQLKPLSLRLNFNREKESDFSVKLSPENLRGVPQDVRVVEIQPSEVTVKLTPVKMKTLRVKADIRGEPAEGYTVTDVWADPTFVDVRGARKSLDSATFVLTEPIDVTGMDKSFTMTLNVAPRLDNTPISCDMSIKVRVSIDRSLVTRAKELPVHLIVPVNYEYDIALKDEKLTVLLDGPEKKLETLMPDECYLVVRVLRRPDLTGPNRDRCELSGPASRDIRLAEVVDVEYTASQKKKGN